MKHLKNWTDWLAESRVQKLIELGLAEPDDFFRLEYELNERLLKRVWEMIQGHTDADPMLSLGVPPIGKQWPVLKGSQSDVFYNASFNLPWPAHLVPAKIRSKAKRLTVNEFLDWIDAQVMDHIVDTWRTPTGWTEGQIIVRSTRTGKVKEVLDPVQESSGAARLMALGLLNPEETDRIEYNINRYALENAYESLRYKGYVPSHKLDAPFFFIYGGRADGASTGRPAGTRVRGLDFLTRDSFTGMSELSGDEFTAKITELFIDWLNTRPEEFFTKEIGLTGRPLLVRDETDALLGMQDWTPLMESQTDGFSTRLSLNPDRVNESTNLDNQLKLMKLGLADPPPYIEYRISILPELWQVLSMPEEARTQEQLNRLIRLYISSDIVQWREIHNRKNLDYGKLSLVNLLGPGPDREIEVGDTEEDFKQWIKIRVPKALGEISPNLAIPAAMIREFGTDDWYSIDGEYLGNINT